MIKNNGVNTQGNLTMASRICSYACRALNFRRNFKFPIIVIATVLFVIGCLAVGVLIWEDQIDEGNLDRLIGIALDGKQVFAAGTLGDIDFSSNDPPELDWLVKAYNSKTGFVLWQDLFGDGEGANAATTIVVKHDRVFAGGATGPSFLDIDWLVRAYKATNGELIWQDQFDAGGNQNFVNDVAALWSRVFAVGSGGKGTDFETVFLVRTYDAKTGNLLWDDEYDKGGTTNIANAVAAYGKRVYVAGSSGASTGEFFLTVRAYDAETGNLLWDDEYDKGAGQNRAFAIAVLEGRVFAAGRSRAGSPDFETFFTVRAYNAETGDLLWDDELDKGGGNNSASAIAVLEGRVFVAGSGQTAGPDSTEEFVVRAYDPKTGNLLWDDQFNLGSGSFAGAGVIAAHGKSVVAAGSGEEVAAPGVRQIIVRAYDTKTGDLIWDDIFTKGGVTNLPLAIEAQRGAVFVGGLCGEEISDTAPSQWFIRAYSN